MTEFLAQGEYPIVRRQFYFGFFFALWILAIWVNPAALAI